MADEPKRKPKVSGKDQLLKLVHNPVQFRVAIACLMLGVWYFAIFGPRSQEIDVTTRTLSQEQQRLALAKQIEDLRKEVGKFEGRLPKTYDPNEWVQYMLAGFHHFHVKVTGLDTEGTKEVGPYKAVIMKMDVEGPYPELDAFLRWVESNERLLRIDRLKVAPLSDSGSQGMLKASLIVLGMTN